MTALSPEKYLEYVRCLNRICDPVTSERDALGLIKTICEENSPGSVDGHSTPLDFVWQVANAVLGPRALSTKGGGRGFDPCPACGNRYDAACATCGGLKYYRDGF